MNYMCTNCYRSDVNYSVILKFRTV